MTWREHLIMAVIGGLAGLLVTVIFILVQNTGVDAGDWLQFAGAFLGVAATISGTLWLQGSAAKEQQRKKAQNLIDALDTVRAVLADIAVKPQQEIKAQVYSLDTVYRHVTWAHGQFESRNFRTHVAIDTLIEVWALEKEQMEKVAKEIATGDDEAISKLLTKVAYLDRWTSGARRAIVEENQAAGKLTVPRWLERRPPPKSG